MNVSVHQRIRVLLEETSDAFASYDTVNADFADFAVLAFSEFKSVLGNPDLTREELIRILRKGLNKHQDKDSASWAVFMAHHIAKAANTGDAKSPKAGFAAWKASSRADFDSFETTIRKH